MNTEEYILSRMERYFLSKEKVENWLDTPHRMLGGTPRELLDTGRGEEILELIFNTIGE